MTTHAPTVGQIAGRLAAEKIEPLVQYVEQATKTKLRVPDHQTAHQNKKGHGERS